MAKSDVERLSANSIWAEGVLSYRKNAQILIVMNMQIFFLSGNIIALVGILNQQIRFIVDM